jgi:osmotically-inducible protein OsmY
MKTTHKLQALMAAGLLCGSLALTGCNQETTERTNLEDQQDQKLAEQVKTAFANSPAFKFPDVQVASFKGKIQLSGFVQSGDQKSAAETIAKGIAGGVEVENQIALKK